MPPFLLIVLVKRRWRILRGFVLGALCLICLVVGLVIENGTALVGIAIVAAVLALASVAAGTVRRVTERRSRRVAR